MARATSRSLAATLGAATAHGVLDTSGALHARTIGCALVIAASAKGGDLMRCVRWIAVTLALSTTAAHAATMRTSYYDAQAPHIAAHRTLPIGTWLVITNPRNGRSAC